jgi:hypothetical protein
MPDRASRRGFEAIDEAAVSLNKDKETLIALRRRQAEGSNSSEPDPYAQYLARAEVAVPGGRLVQCSKQLWLVRDELRRIERTP